MEEEHTQSTEKPTLLTEPTVILKRPKDERFKLGKREIILIILAFLAIVGVAYYAWNVSNRKQEEANAIDTFDECVAAGNPVMESYPEQCAANGRTFVNISQQVPQQ